MLIFRGFGILVVPVAVGCQLAAQIGLDTVMRRPNTVAFGWATAAVACWFLGRKLNGPDGSKQHSFFFIPVEWWSVVLLAAALVNLIGL
jgi:hypothetical protein